MAGCRETVSGGFELGVRVSKAPCFFMYWQYAQKNNIFAARCTMALILLFFFVHIARLFDEKGLLTS